MRAAPEPIGERAPHRAEADVALVARRLGRRGLTGGMREGALAACRRRPFFV
jgi:hypothetical protein